MKDQKRRRALIKIKDSPSKSKSLFKRKLEASKQLLSLICASLAPLEGHRRSTSSWMVGKRCIFCNEIAV